MSDLRRNLFLELVNLVGHNLELAFHLCDLVTGLNQVFAAQVAVTAHRLIECLCMWHVCVWGGGGGGGEGEGRGGGGGGEGRGRGRGEGE